MNAATVVFLVLAAPFALGDWWSRLRHDQRVEYVCKPATLVFLIAAAVALDPAAGAGDRRVWFVAALVFSLAGDVALMLDKFLPGLAAFLVGHVCYIAGFWTDPPAAAAVAVSAVAVGVALGPVMVTVVRAAKDPAVAVYAGVISVMVISALASGNWVAAAGAGFFAFSDTVIAWDRFVRPRPWMPVVIMVTYHLGQLLLVLSLLV